MPDFLQEEIFRQFIYKDFLTDFHRTFTLPNFDRPQKHCHYTWEDDYYRKFMMDVLRTLEPRQEQKGAILLEENDEVSEVLLFFKGSLLALGFELNMKKILAFELTKLANSVGMYELTFNLRSEFFYKTLSVCSGFSIRRCNWQTIIRKHGYISDELKSKVEGSHMVTLKHARRLKQTAIEKLKGRKDLTNVKFLLPITQLDSDSIKLDKSEMR